ncbi:unnamed protein product [Adineta ricciae]|uniref:Uncharacterized protein n=1 Tax=Adineta ricciae TaxID=249248 RepID=A0A814H501_ADIRI|nr:unnamed protein product [Adineta ricciae]
MEFVSAPLEVYQSFEQRNQKFQNLLEFCHPFILPHLEYLSTPATLNIFSAIHNINGSFFPRAISTTCFSSQIPTCRYDYE